MKPLFYLPILMFLLGAGTARAEMMEDITVLSPKALAMANAVVADPPGTDSIHFNPAGLARLTGSIQQLTLATFNLKSRYSTGAQQVDPAAKALYESLTQQPYPADPYANQKGETGAAMALIPGGSTEKIAVPIIPLGGFALRNPDSGVVLATAVYSPMMVGFTRAENDVGRFQGTETAISRITYFSPTVAIPLTDELAVGAGINFNYQGIALSMETRSPQVSPVILGAFAGILTGDPLAPAPYDDLAKLSVMVQDYLSVGFNVGVLWSPQPWLSFGLAYRSSAKSNLKGDFTIRYYESMQHLTSTLRPVLPMLEGAAEETGKVSMELNTPQHLALGTSVKLTPRFKLNLDLQKSFYKAWDAFTFEFSQPIDYLVFGSNFDSDAKSDSLSLRRNYKNALSWSIGGEYEWSDTLSLRAGYQRRTSAIPDDALDLTMPISDADFYGIGFAYINDEQTRFDVGLGYLVSTFDIDYGQSANANGENPFDLVYNPYVFLPIRNTTRAFLLSMSYTRPF